MTTAQISQDISAPGITSVAFDRDLLTTLRSARTSMQNLHEAPTAWALHPDDVETIDLLREGTDGAFLIGEGASNIFGGLSRVVSTSVPAGPGTKNQVVLRAEGRFGFGLLRPQAFAEIALTSE